MDFKFSEPTGHVFFTNLCSHGTVHMVFGVVPGLTMAKLTDKILIKDECIKYILLLCPDFGS